MFKIGVIEKIHQDGIRLLEKHPNFQCEIIEDISQSNFKTSNPNRNPAENNETKNVFISSFHR